MGASSALSTDLLATGIERSVHAQPERIRRRFQMYLEVAPPSECWRWLGTIARGRPLFSVGYRKLEAARVAWVLHKMPLGEGSRLKRDCGTAVCVSPYHHHVEVRKERPRGQQRRLTREELTAMARAYAQGTPMRDIAGAFAISPVTAWYHLRGRRAYSLALGITLPPPRTRRRPASCEHGRDT